MTLSLLGVRSALFVPASNPRALAKARGLGADLVILDLEDAVPDEGKDAAREAMVTAVREGFGTSRVAVRINTARGGLFNEGAQERDLKAVAAAKPDFVVLPKVETLEDILHTGMLSGPRLLAMIESPGAVLDARHIAGNERVDGLIAGTNDLAAELRLPPGAGRGPLMTALGTIVLAARAAGVAVFDGVFNRLDDPEGFAAEAAESRRLGFDGKTLIHPSQVAPCNAAFAPTAEELARAERLVAAAGGGAERFEGEMIERMHVEAAERLLAQRHPGDGRDPLVA